MTGSLIDRADSPGSGIEEEKAASASSVKKRSRKRPMLETTSISGAFWGRRSWRGPKLEGGGRVHSTARRPSQRRKEPRSTAVPPPVVVMGLDLSRVAEGARRLGGYSVVTLLTRKGDTTRSGPQACLLTRPSSRIDFLKF